MYDAVMPASSNYGVLPPVQNFVADSDVDDRNLFLFLKNFVEERLT